MGVVMTDEDDGADTEVGGVEDGNLLDGVDEGSADGVSKTLPLNSMTSAQTTLLTRLMALTKKWPKSVAVAKLSPTHGGGAELYGKPSKTKTGTTLGTTALSKMSEDRRSRRRMSKSTADWLNSSTTTCTPPA